MPRNPLPPQQFAAAPWTTALMTVSSLATAVLLGISYGLYRAIPHGTRVPFAEAFGTLLLFVPPLVLVTALLFIVSGYELDNTTLYVQRLFWQTRIPLDGLDRAWHDSSAMCNSLRVFGNGGLFAVTGLFENASLGRYRAFVTDPKEAVVLHFPSRVLIVSPAHPRVFLGYLRVASPDAVVEDPSSTA